MFIKKLGQFKDNSRTITTIHQFMFQQGLLLFWVPFIVVFVFRNVLNAGSTHFKNIHSSMGAQSCAFQGLFIVAAFASTYSYNDSACMASFLHIAAK